MIGTEYPQKDEFTEEQGDTFPVRLILVQFIPSEMMSPGEDRFNERSDLRGHLFLFGAKASTWILSTAAEGHEASSFLSDFFDFDFSF